MDLLASISTWALLQSRNSWYSLSTAHLRPGIVRNSITAWAGFFFSLPLWNLSCVIFLPLSVICFVLQWVDAKEKEFLSTSPKTQRKLSSSRAFQSRKNLEQRDIKCVKWTILSIAPPLPTYWDTGHMIPDFFTLKTQIPWSARSRREKTSFLCSAKF